VKPARTDGLIQVIVSDRFDQALVVSPDPVSAARAGSTRWLRPIAWMLHAFACALGLIGLAALYRTSPLSWSADDAVRGRAAIFGMFALFFVQGLVRCLPFLERTTSLSGGDDWLAYEAGAREIILNGVLMTYGRPVGQGGPYFYYPLYSYFLAAIHKLVSEDLSGVVFMQFILLAATNAVMYGMARRLFGSRVAVWTLLVLTVQQQLDFVRYYTITLLAENLYFFASAVTVGLLVQLAYDGRRRTAIASALMGGIAALTRPTMMLFYIPAVAFVALADYRTRRTAGGALASATLYAFLWLLAVSPATIRNYVVSGEAVLITKGQATTFVEYNLPEVPGNEKYKAMWTGTMSSSAYVLLTIFREHPREYLSKAFMKVMFSFGMTHWMGQRVHLELIAPSVAYGLVLLFVGGARRWQTWPVHLFIVTHVLTMTLSMPGMYGYRLILPSYVFLDMFAALFIVAAYEWSSRAKTVVQAA
jgi:hypothetical protein